LGGKRVRDQYVGDVSDVIKFALLRRSAGDDRKLGIASYYDPGHDGRSDGRHLEWQDDDSWQAFDPVLCDALKGLPERSVAALENAAMWPRDTAFHRMFMPRLYDRPIWAKIKHEELSASDLIFLDPDNGIGPASAKHATLEELRQLRRQGRTLVFITFPGRRPHDDILADLHMSTAVRFQAIGAE
jgi:hypothetical protein